MDKKVKPINTVWGGAAKTILAGYYKYGCKNLLGDNYGTSGTIVIEIYDNGKQEAGQGACEGIEDGT